MKVWMIAALGLGIAFLGGCGKDKKAPEIRKVKVERGDLILSTNANGSVAPLNEVRILPPVAGRIEQIVAMEGSYVKRGQTLAWMSSIERAALLDGARSGGEEELAKWEQTYKPTAVLAPVAGTVIARNVVSGQTVNSGETLFTISDRLIVLAEVDEADLGKIRQGMAAKVGVDAYPGQEFRAKVSLISQSSVRVNNVITYKVRLEPEKVPPYLRSGMTTNVKFIELEKHKVLVLPLDAVQGQAGEARLNVIGPKGPEARSVVLGEDDGTNVEVIKGLAEGDEIEVSTLNLPEQSKGGIFGQPQRPARQTPRGGARRSGRDRN
jgi:macrolide-specific efflux system membrane fusion protein